MKTAEGYPVYSISVVSELLGLHTATIRMWEKSGITQPPQRRSGKRFYSEKELNRLQFICKLSKEGLSIRAMFCYLRLYPCWKAVYCHGSLHNSDQISGVKPCWQKESTFCQVVNIPDPCAYCTVEIKQEQYATIKEKGLERRMSGNPLENQNPIFSLE